MATLNVDNIVKNTRDVLSVNEYPLDTTGSHDFHQGDLLYQDATSHNVYPLDNDTHAATFVGVAVFPSYIAPFTYAPTGAVQKFYAPSATVGFGCLVRLKTTAADTYVDGTALYAGADAQTVTAVAGSNQIGVAKMAKGVSSVAGGTGVYLNVLLTIKTPISTL